jgi:hypothetical protein
MKKLTTQTFITTLLLILISSWSLTVNASTPPIGRVILSVGDVIAIDASGAERQLKRRSEIFSGDTLTTETGARCQIRFSDKSLVALSQNSTFKVDEYSFNQSNVTQEKAIYSLLKGGMRTISGAIGKENRDDYQLNTPVATIGIRGTAFNIALLDENDVQNLYGTVDSGAIVVENEQGQMQIEPGQNFQVPKNQSPRLIISLPVTYPSNTEDSGEPAEGEDEGEGESLTEFSGGENGDELTPDDSGTPVGTAPNAGTSPDPTTTSTTDIVTVTGTFAPSGAAVGFALVGDNSEGVSNKSTIFFNKGSDEVYIDTIGGIGNVPVAGAFYDGDCNPCAFISATGSLVAGSTGGDATIGVNWGRWTGSYIVTENGVPATNMGDFHYIYSPNVTPDAMLQTLTGTNYYNNVAGGTQPTDQNGAVGTLNWLNIDVNFSNQTVTNLDMSITTTATNTINAYSLSGPLAIPLNDLTGSGISIDATNGFDPGTSGLNGYVGEIQGTFVGPNAEGLMTTYGFRENTNPSTNAASGTALLTQGGV